MIIEKSYSNYSIQKPFIDYFDRLYSVGFSFDEIEQKIPSLEKYYKDIVLNKINKKEESKSWVYHKTALISLFKDWKDFELTILIKF